MSAAVPPQVEKFMTCVAVEVQRNQTSWWMVGHPPGCCVPSVDPIVDTAIVPVVTTVVAVAQSSEP